MSITLNEETIAYYSKEIMRRKEVSKKIGHVWSIDISGIPPEFIEQNHHNFCNKLWGLNIPKNNTLQADEKEMIDSIDIQHSDKIWEVGCGAGRIIKYLVNYSDNILGTDISEEILKNVKEISLNGVRTLTDNILETKISESDFDCILAFENFFGNFVGESKRLRALINITQHLKIGGRFVFSYRIMGDRSVDQLDVFHNDPSIFGLWHAFTHNEIQGLLTQLNGHVDMEVESIIHTDRTRPIGGKVSYVILRKCH